jgi:hypothetical protein
LECVELDALTPFESQKYAQESCQETDRPSRGFHSTPPVVPDRGMTMSNGRIMSLSSWSSIMAV